MTTAQEAQADSRVVDEEQQHKSGQYQLCSAPIKASAAVMDPTTSSLLPDTVSKEGATLKGHQDHRDRRKDESQEMRNLSPPESGSTCCATATVTTTATSPTETTTAGATTSTSHIPESTRPDGSIRSPIKIRSGFEPRGLPFRKKDQAEETSKRSQQNRPAPASEPSPPPPNENTTLKTASKWENAATAPGSPASQIQQSVRPDGSVRPAVRIRPGFQVRDLPVRGKPQTTKDKNQGKPSPPPATAAQRQPPLPPAQDQRTSKLASSKVEQDDISNSGISINPNTGEREVPQSIRPDGTVRRAIRIRPGYVPKDDIQPYVPRRVLENRQKQAGATGAVAATPSIVPKRASTDEKKETRTAATKANDTTSTATLQPKQPKQPPPHSSPSQKPASNRPFKSGLVANAQTGGFEVPASVRPDGSVRRPIKIRPGKAPMNAVGAVSKGKAEQDEEGTETKGQAVTDKEGN